MIYMYVNVNMQGYEVMVTKKGPPAWSFKIILLYPVFARIKR